jgi:hypothetical protein
VPVVAGSEIDESGRIARPDLAGKSIAHEQLPVILMSDDNNVVSAWRCVRLIFNRPRRIRYAE